MRNRTVRRESSRIKRKPTPRLALERRWARRIGRPTWTASKSHCLIDPSKSNPYQVRGRGNIPSGRSRTNRAISGWSPTSGSASKRTSSSNSSGSVRVGSWASTTFAAPRDPIRIARVVRPRARKPATTRAYARRSIVDTQALRSGEPSSDRRSGGSLDDRARRGAGRATRTRRAPALGVVSLGMRSSVSFGFVVVVGISGCPSAGSSQAEPPDPTESTAASGEPEPADDSAVAGASAEDSGSIPGPTLPAGPACQTDAECDAEQVCEGLGCGANEGRCVARDRMCTRDLATYCGCDGKEFKTSGSCPGARFAHRGPCQPALGLGEACTSGQQCSSGLCAGEGLEGCGTGATGVCSEAGCTKDLASYCGCNGFEFSSSGSCPNQQFAYRGPCEG